MIAYDRLSQIIPPDQALACKAMQVSLQQINNVAKMELATLANAASAIETTRNLPLLNNQSNAVSSTTANYYLNTLGVGTGECHSILTVDCLGTAIGWVVANALNNTTAVINSTNVGGITSIYNTMQQTINGTYTEEIPNPGTPPPTYVYQVVIPSGPAAGTYPASGLGELTPALAINNAFTNGLIPAAQAACAGYTSGNPTAAANMNAQFNAICQQMGNEQDLQKRAGLNFGDGFANLVANSQQNVFGLVFNLPSYGLETTLGDNRTYMEGVANTSNQTGQAVIGAMREGTNQVGLDLAGVQTASHVPVTPANVPPQGTFLASTYTPDEARGLDRAFPPN